MLTSTLYSIKSQSLLSDYKNKNHCLHGLNLYKHHHIFYWGFGPKLKNEWNKWKNHFSETRRCPPKDRKPSSPIPTSLFYLCINLPTEPLN